MNRDDIIRMAREAGLEAYSILPHKEIDWDCLVDDLATFAALVAAAEREQIIAANAPEIEKVNAYIKALEDELAAIRARKDKQ